MNKREMVAFAVCLGLLLSVKASAQATATIAPPVILRVSGEVETPLKFTAAEIAKLPRQTLKVKGHDGKLEEFEGVLLAEVLKLAGMKFGEELRGKKLALYLLVEALDGYRIVFALPELDSAYTDKVVLIADKREGKPIDQKEGPLRLVVSEEKRQARWVRQVTGLVIKRGI